MIQNYLTYQLPYRNKPEIRPMFEYCNRNIYYFFSNKLINCSVVVIITIITFTTRSLLYTKRREYAKRSCHTFYSLPDNLLGTTNHSLAHGAEPFLRSRQWYSHSRTSQNFMEPEGSLPCSQEHSTGLYPKPYQSNPHHPILSI
jgi:hypothetical protein